MSKPSIDRFSGRYAWASNFALCTVWILVGTKWVKCPTLEHGFQASKTLNKDERMSIIQCASPAMAKRYGQTVNRVAYWEEIKRIVMLELLRQKYSHVAFARRLRATNDLELIEGNNWHDNYWGSCVCETCENCGENWLGRLTMRVRRDIR